ncbi:MAG: ATP-binding protein [Lachnospiraceae bacterium]|jgi:MinD superfamily P-loop ATPase
MQQLLILSGKGGTGKTTIAGAFIRLADAKAYADCDVDAPNLHLVTEWKTEPKKTNYYGLPKAKINPELCIRCDQCRQNCRFDAVLADEIYKVNPFACEGCGVCKFICPAQAITMIPSVDGELNLYSDAGKVFSTAQLKMGSGTSGLLVTEVKKQMKSAAVDADLAIIDGSPGIGCPVIASLSGADMVLVVAEPSVSGISDMERIIDTAAKFGIKTAVCINKYDINIENTKNIEDFCKKQGLPLVGSIPYDPDAVKAVNNGQTIADIDCKSGKAVKEVYHKTMNLLFAEISKNTEENCNDENCCSK